MPIYLFENPKTGETVEVIQGMKDRHTFIDDQGVEWVRVFSVPNATIDTQVDPFSPKSFKASTDGKNMTVGNLWDKSKEMSEKRAQKLGTKDPVKEKYESGAREARKGKQIRD